MRILLDTNIVIHRENKIVSNYSIGHLFRWIDRLKYEKIIHPYTISEINKYRDPVAQEVMAVKLESYEVLKTVNHPDIEFLSKIGRDEKNENDHIDNCLLYEVYLGHVDYLITEDRKLRNKAPFVGLGDCVFSINGFISKVTEENPSLVEYKALSVEKVFFGEVNINDNFFDSFRISYDGFNQWFNKKCDEEAYICKSDDGKILGFLYLKTEDYSENYFDIAPPFPPKKRLKVGTFKVESTGFRLGERFIKIIFDNAIQRNVDEIYVTLFSDRPELVALEDLLCRWGFFPYGSKFTGKRTEKVLVKRMKVLLPNYTPKKNFPNISYSCNKYIIPIFPQYHTSLLPDSQLRTENRIDFLGKEPHRYALQKVYISWAINTNEAKPGDMFLFYRPGEDGSIKKYTSVLTTIAIVDEIISDIRSEHELLSLCQNRSVFTTAELKYNWINHGSRLKVIKFIFVKSLNKRLTLEYLWENNIVEKNKGPRPFTKISDEQFDMIVRDSNTIIKYVN